MAAYSSPPRARVSGAFRRNLTTSAAVAALALVVPAGATLLAPTPAKAQAECGALPLVGTLLCPGPTYPGGIDYTGVAGDILIDLDATAEALETVVLDATGDIVFTAQGDTMLTGGAGEGLIATAGDTVTLALDAVETTADGGEGVLVDAGGDVLLGVDSVLTSGDTADAVNIDGDGAITVTAGDLMTSGEDSEGVELVTLSGPVSLTADLIETLGDGSTGALVEAVGDTDVSVGVLRTEGFEAAGLDLSVDPAACVLLGAGGCDTSFTATDLGTEGDGATGVLVRAAGNVTGDVGILTTEGEDAVGLDIAADPDACIILGAGNCGVDIGGGSVSTGGDGATGVLVRAAGDVLADFTAVNTEGDNANAIDIAVDPAVCLVIGAGACGVEVDADDVDTGGDGSGGVVVDSPGPVVVDVGDVNTEGDDSDGIHVDGGDEPVDVDADTVTTEGDDSEGVEVVANGPIDIDVDVIVTEGDGSEGVLVDGGAGEVTVDVGSTTTGGAGSDGINTSTTTGDTTITVGDVTTTGPGSDGIEADSVSGDISIVINDDVTATGDGANANTGGAVNVVIGPGADVFGGDDGLDLTSGAGTTVVNNGTLEGGAGVAIDVGGAAAMIDNNGTIIGGVELTGGADMVVNDGMFMADEDSDFGAGSDTFTNNGEVEVEGEVEFAGLEQFTNNGLIDMIDGVADDSLTLPGDYTGGAGAGLAVDVDLGSDGTPADMLIVGGEADGVTTVTVNNIADGPGVLNPDGVVIIDAGTAADGAFVLDGGPVVDGFVDFDLMTDGGQVLLVGSPNQGAFEVIRSVQVLQESWYASADAWRGAVMTAAPTDGGRWWGQFYGFDRTHDGQREVAAFGVTSMRDLSYDHQHWGYQMGADRAMAGGRIGLTTGFFGGTAQFAQSATGMDVSGWNAGLYGGWGADTGPRLDVLAKYDRFSLGYSAPGAGLIADLDGRSWGVQADLGWRMGSALFVEPQASLAYVSTDLDGFESASAAIDYDDADSLRGKAGVLVGWQGAFLGLHAVHEFQGENGATFSSGGFDLPLVDEPDETYGLVTLGADAEITGVDAFARAEGAFGDVEGWGLRFGIRASW